MRLAITLATLIAVASPVLADPIAVTYGSPGQQSADFAALNASAGSVIGSQSFDSAPRSGSFTTDFGTGGVITASYAGNESVLRADQYGGAGGSGGYIVTFGSDGYTIHLATSGVPGVNYFGFWLSALDAGNQVVFRRAGAPIGTYQPTDLISAIGSNQAYFGNPNAAFKGQDASEPFAFVNFFDTVGFFDEIDVFESPTGGGYESDNHTVGYRPANSVSGNTLVPEPPAIAAFALAGIALTAARRSSTASRGTTITSVARR